MIALRPLGMDDITAFAALRLGALRDHPTAFGSSYQEESAEAPAGFARWLSPAPPGCTLGAFDGDALVGMAALLVPARLKQRHKGMINGVYVAPTHRGQGISEKLVRDLIGRARAGGLAALKLTVVVGNDRARQVYEACGFTEYGIEPRALRVDGQDVDEALMGMDL